MPLCHDGAPPRVPARVRMRYADTLMLMRRGATKHGAQHMLMRRAMPRYTFSRVYA